MGFYGYTNYEDSFEDDVLYRETRRRADARTPKQLAKEEEKREEKRLREEQQRKDREFRQHGKQQCSDAVRTRHLRLEELADGNGSRARAHIELADEDEVNFDGFFASAQHSCTCQALDEEELQEQSEELIRLMQEESEDSEMQLDNTLLQPLGGAY